MNNNNNQLQQQCCRHRHCSFSLSFVIVVLLLLFNYYYNNNNNNQHNTTILVIRLIHQIELLLSQNKNATSTAVVVVSAAFLSQQQFPSSVLPSTTTTTRTQIYNAYTFRNVDNKRMYPKNEKVKPLFLSSSSTTTTTSTSTTEQQQEQYRSKSDQLLYQHHHHHHQEQQEQQQQLYKKQLLLLSLQSPESYSSNSNNIRYRKELIDIWKWKDDILGNGHHDYIVSYKCQTLYTLQSYIIQYINNNNNNKKLYNNNNNTTTEIINSNQNNKNNNTTTVPPIPFAYNYSISECVIISNCARFEILLIVNIPIIHNNYNNNNNNEVTNVSIVMEQMLVNDINTIIHQQVIAYQYRIKHQNTFLTSTKIYTFLDRPSNIDISSMDETIDMNTDNKNNNNSNIIYQHQHLKPKNPSYWTIMKGSYPIIYHLCHVSIGIASRPRREQTSDTLTLTTTTTTTTNRNHTTTTTTTTCYKDDDIILPIFRPFSSRDAHVLQQLKRTITNVATVCTVTNINNKATSSSSSPTMINNVSISKPKTNKPSSSYLYILLRYAIQAGKQARNPQYFVILQQYQKLYGTISNNPKYDVQPSQQFMKQVIKSLYEVIINPTVHECINYLDTIMMESSSTSNITIATSIQHFRHAALSMVTSLYERQYVLQQIHAPTLYLRNNNNNNNSIHHGSSQSRLINVHHLSSSESQPLLFVWNETHFLEELSTNLTKMRDQNK